MAINMTTNMGINVTTNVGLNMITNVGINMTTNVGINITTNVAINRAQWARTKVPHRSHKSKNPNTGGNKISRG